VTPRSLRPWGLVSSILGILAFLPQPAGTIKDVAPAALVAVGGSSATLLQPHVNNRAEGTLALPARRSTIQSSSGAQSPNVNGVLHTVHIQYGSTAVEMPEGSTKNSSPVVPALSEPAGSTIQISHGAQSPNVSGVGGDVDIRYGPPSASAEKWPGGAK